MSSMQPSYGVPHATDIAVVADYGSMELRWWRNIS